MNTARIQEDRQCTHNAPSPVPAGLALVTFENSDADSHSFASALCDAMPARVMQGVCHFKLPSPEGLLADCLAGYKAAILIDSTKIGTLTGTISISDLSTMLERAVPLNIGSVHGFALADELRQAKRLKQLPARIIFFGLEVDALERTEDLTKVVEPKMLTSVKNASLLLETIVETLKKEACTIMLAETAQSAGSRVLN